MISLIFRQNSLLGIHLNISTWRVHFFPVTMADYYYNNETQHSLQNLLSFLYNSNDYSDVTLVCSDQVKIVSHKAVLGASSPLFNSILTMDGDQTIFLPDVEAEHVAHLLTLFYLGQTSVATNKLDQFLSLMSDLKVKDIIKKEPKINHRPVKSEMEITHANPTVRHYRKLKRKVKKTVYERKQILNTKPVSQKQIFSVEESVGPIKTAFVDTYDHFMTLDEDEFYKCSNCDYLTRSTTELQVHVKSRHSKFECRMCGMSFKRNVLLNAHMTSAHPTSNAKYLGNTMFL